MVKILGTIANDTPTQLIVFDIDDVLADTTHRAKYIDRPKDKQRWDLFYKRVDRDTPIQHGITLLRALKALPNTKVEIWTGRSEEVRDATSTWLQDNAVVVRVRMRPVGDYTSNPMLKQHWAKKHGLPSMVIESQTEAAKMWRDLGVPVLFMAN